LNFFSLFIRFVSIGSLNKRVKWNFPFKSPFISPKHIEIQHASRLFAEVLTFSKKAKNGNVSRSKIDRELMCFFGLPDRVRFLITRVGLFKLNRSIEPVSITY